MDIEEKIFREVMGIPEGCLIHQRAIAEYSDIRKMITKAIQMQAEVMPNEVVAGGSWDIYSILSKLNEAADILLHKKDYDGHGWEEIEHCHKITNEILLKHNSQREA